MSDWAEVGTVDYEDLTVVVYQRPGFVRVALVDAEGEMDVTMAPWALDQFRELLDRAAMPGQAARAGRDGEADGHET